MQKSVENSDNSEDMCNSSTPDGDVKNVNADDWKLKVEKRTDTSITISWDLIKSADVYQVEQHHRVRGWHEVAWTGQCSATVKHLPENFAFKFRAKALKLNKELGRYEEFKKTEELVFVQACTLTALPSTLSLHRAIKKGERFLVKRILQCRPKLIELPGPNDYLPLANAIIYGEMCIIDILVTAGANIRIGNVQNGRTPLHVCIRGYEMQNIRTLSSNEIFLHKNTFPLQLTFYHGNLAAARMLLNMGADLNGTDADGMTACHFAVDANQYEMLKFALDNGANLEAKDASGWTLLMRAVVMEANLNVLKLLVTSGADMNTRDMFGQTCVDLARLYNNEIAKEYFKNNKK
ncbi:fibronectin type 3 and ankyrin repeat domains protein 1-like [Teleopsis dalmanni]|uniref:fibronectin type 3 and ankyrin repeat domains protein 1-like n=1 Tax=Teleopsis dalmanni TaxID=139649 RepID=UPI0018CE0AF7|nr:fibronectin type 3 and ankyrin repeat domains protein 1-like [Teleopsis dalmanni]